MSHLWTFVQKNASLVILNLSLCRLGRGIFVLEVRFGKRLLLGRRDLAILLIVSLGILLNDGRVGY